MKCTHRPTSPRVIRLISSALCYSLILTTVFLPLTPGVTAEGRDSEVSSSSSVIVPSAGLFRAAGRVLASVITLVQGSGLPSVPGSNLPDLDTARAIQPSDPVTPAAIVSTQACTDCMPCPTCGPGSLNHAPAAQAGGPYYGTVGTPVGVSGLGSFDVDPGDDISAYAWTFGDGTGVVTGATPVHTYAAPGNYTISLTVSDSHNANAMASTTAAITAPPPSVPPSGTTQGNSALFIAQTVPTTMTAGQSYPVSVTMRNTGTTTWSAAHLYRLGAENPLDNSLWGTSRIHLPTTVAPGADVTFNFTVIAPYSGADEPPPAQFQWRMVQEFVQWFDTSTPSQTVTIISNYQPGQGGTPELGPFSDLFASRIAVEHRIGQPGEDLLSGNYNWGLGLVGLAGRSGLNLNLGLAYNSLAAWTKVVPAVPPSGKLQATSFTFDADRGFPSAGFRLGFPSIQGPFTNLQTSGSSYLALMPSGGRVELRRVGATNVYEAADSSYLQLVEGGNGSLLLRTTDGTQLAYWSINSEYRCTEVKDRNGNFLTIRYDPINGTTNLGRMTSIIDTLGRTLNFNYDSNYRLQSISQLRNGQTHLWATFGYTDKLIETNFINPSTGPAPVVLGLPSNHIVSVLTQVGLADGSRYNFDYTSWGQVYRIRHSAADGHELNYTSYNLPPDNSTPQTDCPLFTTRQDKAENWNNNNPVTSTFQIDPTGTSGEVTTAGGTPDQVTYKEFFKTEYSDWKRGLVTRTEIITPNPTTLRKTTITDWTQDATNVAYPLNPRPTAITVSDAEGNRRRTKIEYGAFGLPSEVYEQGPYSTNDWRTLRRTHTDYNLSDAYVNRRIIGLVAGQYLFAPDANGYSIQTLLSKATMEYDAGGEFLQGQGSPVVQHDDINYLWSFIQGRGNVTAARRWDVNHETDISKSTASTVGYNTTGSAVFSRDPVADHQTTISYADSFSTNGIDTTTLGFATLAYPTMVTINDPGLISSTVRYNYDLGVVTRKEGPPPAGHQQGAIQTTEYDSAGRVKKITNAVNGAYTRFVYPPSQTFVNKFTTIQEGQGEAYSATVFDGVGRVRALAGDFPNSTGHYSGQFTRYDVVGRAVLSTNPTEMNHAWAAAGDDSAGWHSSLQNYDWKGRPLVTTNNDGTTKEGSYGGCGCAGGEVVTLTDEGTVDGGVAKRRQQKIYSDTLGRTVKTEVLTWEGGSPYATTINTYNARDQITRVRQFDSAQGTVPVDLNDLSCPSGSCQQTTMTYDGYGRLKTKRVPEQDEGVATTWNYNTDDTVQNITDARGSVVNYTYNARHLVKAITYDPSAGITDTPDVLFGYDNAGNRTSMSDGLGSVSYGYDQLSRMRSETRIFTGVGTFPIGYEYNLAGKLKKITDSSNVSINYGYDTAGRLDGVTGSDNLYAGVSQYASNLRYRASGSIHQITDGSNHTSTFGYNSRLQVNHFDISSGVVNQNYDYYNDGQISIVHNTTDAKFDNSYQYDHAGRLTFATSGNNVNQTAGSVPYDESFEYDAFSNSTRRGTKSWGQLPFPDVASYANGRRTGWGYDADGRIKTIDTRTYNYDAAGNNVELVGRVWLGNSYAATNVPMGFDGDGHKVTETTTFPTFVTTYYLTSTALNGAVIEELTSSGQKNIGYVYTPGGQLLATQRSNRVRWKHRSLAGTSEYEIVEHEFGEFIGQKEFDPLGANVGLEAPESTFTIRENLPEIYLAVPAVRLTRVLRRLRIPPPAVSG